MTRFLSMMMVLMGLVLSASAHGQSCFSQSVAPPTFQYSGDGGGGSCYSQSYVAPTTQYSQGLCPNGTCDGSSCMTISPQFQAPWMTSRVTTGRLVSSQISPNAIYFPAIEERSTYQATSPTYQPARPRSRVRTVMMAPVYSQAPIVSSARQPAFTGFFRGSGGGGCPGGICR